MRYLVNSIFLTVATDARPGIREGERNGGWSYDVFVISAGPNSVFETPFAIDGAYPRGDDIIYVLSGDTR